MRKLLKLDYDLTRTAPDKYQDGAEVGIKMQEVKHCTAYLPVIDTATLADCELYTLPGNLPDGMYVLQIDTDILPLLLYRKKAYILDSTFVLRYCTVSPRTASIKLHGRYVDITAQRDGVTVTLAAVPTTNITASLVNYRRSSKDGFKDVSI